jgi:thiamine biosynthesis protein ThiI
MNHYLVRYSGELGTKAANTRWEFIKILSRNITRGLRAAGIQDMDVKAGWDVCFVETDLPSKDLLTRIPGISGVSEVTVRNYESIDKVYEEATQIFQPIVQDRTYAVRGKVGGNNKGLLPKMELERELGARLIDFGKVDLTDPQVTCRVEIRDNKIFYSHDREQGLNGLPVGALGKGLTLLSGGIDSPVAAWKAYRSGMAQHFIYFDLGGETQIDIAMESARFVHDQFAPGSRARMKLIDFKPVITEILKANPKYHNLILKYFFYKASERIALELHCDALVTGEALGQVSTQTLKNLATLDQMTDLLIVRPLSTSPKVDIMAEARKIGTYEMAYKGKEYCAISTKGVATTSTKEKLMAEIDRLDMQVLEDALASEQNIDLWREAEAKETPQTDIPSGSTIIDLRGAGQFEKDGLTGSKNIPFQEAWAEYPHWNKDEKYFLVCEVGSQSTILSEYMKKDGYEVEHLAGGIKTYLQQVTSAK